MSAWGSKLYEDDDALDLKDLLSILIKMPGDGDDILKIIQDNYEGSFNLEEDGTVFWLVLADQFEKKGIPCSKVFEMAIQIIKNGVDIRQLQDRGMDDSDLKAREKELEQLLFRFENPKPEKVRKSTNRLPAFGVETGDIYTFPTMKGEGFNAWFSSCEQAGFQPDGWGALIILSQGRVFDWFPWFTYACLKINGKQEITFEKALESKLWLKDSACEVCVPNQNHMKRMKMELLGNVLLNTNKSTAIKLNAYGGAKSAVLCGWTICNSLVKSKQAMYESIKVSEILLHPNQRNKLIDYLYNFNPFKN